MEIFITPKVKWKHGEPVFFLPDITKLYTMLGGQLLPDRKTLCRTIRCVIQDNKAVISVIKGRISSPSGKVGRPLKKN